MRAGALRNPIEIQRRVQVGVDSTNAPNMVWQMWRDPLAEITVLRGREHFDPLTKQRYSEEVWHFRTRYEEVVGVDASMRVVYDGNEYDIKAIRPDGEKRIDCILECVVQDISLGGAALSIAIKEEIAGGTVSIAYAGFTVEAAGGATPYAFGGTGLPDGLALNSATGEVSGTPTTPGTSSVDIVVTDGTGDTAALPTFNIFIA